MPGSSDGGYSDYYTSRQGVRSSTERLAELQRKNRILRNKLIILTSKQKHEELLRDEHKSLQNAWESYQIMLKLVQGGK